ncbi:hypothetical protein BGY98DRAFT_1167367 [Russula aff. rugulosa BPL654]|nr:hypothetical protein BGY98DRAFT_1167367 [Russula aff. rugulosa BPL654]
MVHTWFTHGHSCGVHICSCLLRLERRRAAREPRVPSPRIHHFAEQDAIDDREGVASERLEPSPRIHHFVEQDAVDDREDVASEPLVSDDFDDDTQWMDIDLPQNSAVSTREKNCFKTCDNGWPMSTCGTCHEHAFDLTTHRQTNECSRCHADKHENGKQWSNANNVTHFATAVQPDCLKGLTDIEEMLIARIKPIMHLCYKDHIVNLPQDIADVAERLPRLPQDLDVLIIRRRGEDLDQHCEMPLQIANDPSYADLQQPDEHALLALPVHGSVAHMIPACLEPTDSPPSATAPTGPTEAANALPEQVDDDDDGNERFLGGVLNVGPSHATETEHVRQGVQEIIQRPLHNNENIIDAPTPDALRWRDWLQNQNLANTGPLPFLFRRP